MSDRIRREDAVKAFEDVLDCDFYRISEETPRERIESIPSADRPQGEWNGYNADKGDDWLRDDGTPIFLICDQCNGVVIHNGSAHWNYCPNCGARMKGADDE